MACRLDGAQPLSEPMLEYCYIVNWTLWNKFQWNFNRNSNIFIQENAFENIVCEMSAILSRPQCVKALLYFIVSGDITRTNETKATAYFMGYIVLIPISGLALSAAIWEHESKVSCYMMLIPEGLQCGIEIYITYLWDIYTQPCFHKFCTEHVSLHETKNI